MLGRVLLAAALLSLVAPEQEKDWVLIWEDDFDYLDFHKWQHEINARGGGNEEFQMYTNDPRNSYTRDGVLYLKPTLTTDVFGPYIFENGSVNMFDYGYCSQWTDVNGCYREREEIPPTMSARLRSFQRFAFKYGKIVVEAKMPVGDWLWPAIWFLPEDWTYGGWPKSGEIDLVEIIGNRDLRNIYGDQIGIERMGSAMHWGPSRRTNKFYLTHDIQDNAEENYADYFHTYEMEWDESRIITRVDGKDVMRVPSDEEMENWKGFWDFGMRHGGMNNDTNVWTDDLMTNPKMAPFDHPFHILLNVAVGGTVGFIPDDVINANGTRPKPWPNHVNQTVGQVLFWADRDNWYPTWKGEDCAMQIDSIRVYQKGIPPETPPPDVGGTTIVSPSVVTILAGVVYMAFYKVVMG